MVNDIGNVGRRVDHPLPTPSSRNSRSRATEAQPRDRVEFSGRGRVDIRQMIEIVTERSVSQVRWVVSEASAQLELPQGADLDTSASATALRIADFALDAFDQWREGRQELSGEEARAQFAGLIGPAIDRGIAEAQRILTALNAMSSETTSFVNDVESTVHQRLDGFVNAPAD